MCPAQHSIAHSRSLWAILPSLQNACRCERALATALIAVGGLIAAAAHSLGVLSGIELFRVSELIALVFIFVGFVLSTPAARPAVTTTAPHAAGS